MNTPQVYDATELPGAEGIEARIHASGHAFVLAVTGGGASAIARLLAVPGGSHSILEALVPYSSVVLDDFLHARPEQYCSARTARAMAMVAFGRARRWSSCSGSPGRPTGTLVGVGGTASLASDRPKRGPHRAHVALQTESTTTTCSLHLTGGARARAEEERLVGELILDSMAAATGLNVPTLRGELESDERLEVLRTVAPSGWRELLMGLRPSTLFREDGVSTEPPRIVFPGAFHPLHAGHQAMARVAERRYGVPVAFELSIENVDKPPLDYSEIAARGEQFGEATLWLTRAPTFIEKSRLFPHAVFVVGADTIARIADPKYYGGSADACRDAIAEIAQRGCRFLVFGRNVRDEFRTLDALPLPSALRVLCDDVGEEEFRVDISSTELRRRAGDATDGDAESPPAPAHSPPGG